MKRIIAAEDYGFSHVLEACFITEKKSHSMLNSNLIKIMYNMVLF
ncbi:Uncharacterised protein [Legionella spiritensis]|nr:Uncharacterised protein [Legionella spiritensis]